MNQNTYRKSCHIKDCDTRFIGADREDYVDHLRDAHGDLIAELWDRLITSPNDGGCTLRPATDDADPNE